MEQGIYSHLLFILGLMISWKRNIKSRMKDRCSHVKGEERQFGHMALPCVFDEGIVRFAKECIVNLFIRYPVIGKDRVIVRTLLKILRSFQISTFFIRQSA